jgi:hypothetical protein
MYKIIGADGKEYGPVSTEQLRQWLTEGRVNNLTRVLAEGGTDWRALGDIPEFAPAPAGIPQPPTGYPSGFRPVASSPVRMNGFAITGLVFGIISLPMSICCAGIPFNILGIIFSAIALSQIKHKPDEFTGRSIAIGGLVCSIIGVILGATIVTLSLVFNWGGRFLEGK